MLPLREMAGALEQLRQQREHRRRVALGGGRLAGGQSDFALGHGEARERIDHQQHVLALRGEIFRDGGGGQGRADARKRRLVGGGHHHHRARQAFLAECVFQKLAHFAAALAHQGQHGEIGGGAAGHHAHQRAFAHAAAAENAHALPAPAGEHSVDGADAAAQRLANERARQRQRGVAAQRPVFAGAVGPLGIERLAGAVDHPPEQSRAHAQAGPRAAGDDAVAVADARGPFERHGKHLLAAKARRSLRPGCGRRR